MAAAGRSHPNVPVIVRGSLEDPSDFGPRTPVLVVTAQPARAQAAVPPVTILRGTLRDPPVLTTPGPVVVAAAADRRWFSAVPVTVIAAPQAPAAAPGPVVVAPRNDRRWYATPSALVLAGAPAAPPVSRGLLMAGIT